MRTMLFLFVGAASIKYVGVDKFLDGFSIALFLLSLILCIIQDIRETVK